MIPGSNILNMALRLIGKQTVTYIRYLGRETSATGRDVSRYAPPVEISTGSFQPINANRYADMGLDFQKEYCQWWISADVLGVGRDASGDLVEYAGKRYQIQKTEDWLQQDGWKAALCVRISQ